MIASPQSHPRMTGEDYLAWEATQELRHEFIDGEILAMTGGTIPHNDIALNLYRALYPHIRQRGCRINVSDVKVQARANSQYFYPDLVVTCDSDDLNARDFIQHPKVIVEVLSPSTANYDRTTKLKHYRQIPTLQNYVLVDSEVMSVEVYQRSEGKMWLYDQYEMGEAIALPSIEFDCPIELIYEGITFDEAKEA
ncbi:MAG: Uma2 family endonuclease [Leptolyngbyaceae bacterium]|nr:Uma2 family endonuclease [Leptolyngbyaceae bacterium]